MSNVIQYKGYFTNVEYSQEDQILFGKIEGIRDLVTFECENAGEVEQAFKEAVDDYLEFCEEEGKDPNKSFSGSFNVRVSPELHRDIWAAATKRDMTLNAYVNEALRASLKKRLIQWLFFLSHQGCLGQSMLHNFPLIKMPINQAKMDFLMA